MASGDTMARFAAAMGAPAGTNFAPIIRRNGHYLAAFDAGTDESVDFEDVLPDQYGGGGLTVELVWVSEDQTTGNVIWNAQIERIQDDVTDIDADSFAAVQTVTAAAASAAGEPSYDSITFTAGSQMDSLAAGEAYRLRITRDADNASDTMTNDAQLMRVYVTET